mgnify:CR=1 FL=1
MTNGSKRDVDLLSQTAQKVKDKGAIHELLRSDDTKRMMDMLGSQDSVQNAAKAAAAGDPAQLMGMMQQLMSTREGAALVERITKQAQQSGL